MNRSGAGLRRAVFFAAVGAAAAAGRGENLVANGSFERIEGGVPAEWAAVGDAAVRQRLTAAEGKVGRWAARLECSAFEARGPASHAMLAQTGRVALEKGRLYRFSCWMRCEALAGRQVRVAVSDTSRWSNCGLNAAFRLGRAWRRYETFFTAARTVGRASRLQLWFCEVGTVWVDDVRIEPVERPALAFTDGIEPGETPNLLPNGSFECGADGWASLGAPAGWGNLAGLFGRVEPGGARHGERCLRVALGGGRTAVTYFDYFRPVAVAQTAPLAANAGWIRAEKGAAYTLSAWMRADRDGVGGRLAVRLCEPGGWPNTTGRAVRLTRRWRRYTFTFRPWRGWFHVAVGPDLGGEAGAEATVWIDAVQVEKAAAATDFAPRQAVEVGVETGRFGNVFAAGQPVELVVSASNATAAEQAVEVAATGRDFFDRRLSLGRTRLVVPAAGAVRRAWRLPLAEPGWYGVRLDWTAGRRRGSRRLRLAVIRPYGPGDSPFGVNHAPPTGSLCRLLRSAGVVWARDWSLKWQHLEPVPGRFDPAPGDVQVDRVRRTGMQVLCLLPPFPSSDWASSAPAGVRREGYPGERLAMAYAPKDPNRLAEYVARCVRHFRGRVRVWEFLNEPLFTDYSLPAASKGLPGAAYTAADYVRLLRLAAAAMKRADPSCVVVGGIGGGPDTFTREFIAAGGLEAIDAMNLHVYPSQAPPEGYIGPMRRLREQMRRAGRVRPIWITEYSYYAADRKPWRPYVPRPGGWAGSRLLDSERRCADYSVRFAAVMLAGGGEKIFYHSGASGEVNRESLECCLVGYAGAPRKVFAAQAALAGLLGARPRGAGRLAGSAADGGAAEGVWGFAFQSGRRGVLVAWADTDVAAEGWRLDVPAGAEVLDIVGRVAGASRAALGPSPLYVVSDSLGAAELARSCRLIRPGG